MGIKFLSVAERCFDLSEKRFRPRHVPTWPTSWRIFIERYALRIHALPFDSLPLSSQPDILLITDYDGVGTTRDIFYST